MCPIPVYWPMGKYVVDFFCILVVLCLKLGLISVMMDYLLIMNKCLPNFVPRGDYYLRYNYYDVHVDYLVLWFS